MKELISIQKRIAEKFRVQVESKVHGADIFVAFDEDGGGTIDHEELRDGFDLGRLTARSSRRCSRRGTPKVGQRGRRDRVRRLDQHVRRRCSSWRRTGRPRARAGGAGQKEGGQGGGAGGAAQAAGRGKQRKKDERRRRGGSAAGRQVVLGGVPVPEESSRNPTRRRRRR